MKKYKTRKSVKGFTLTELAIVIAVIAILVAVLVPTFIALINKAKESNDTQMIYNVNNALTIENATKAIETPAQALDVAEATGYNIENLTPTSDSEIFYDQENVRFLIVYSDGTIYPSEAENTDFSSPYIWYFVDQDAYQSILAKQTASVNVQTAKKAITSNGTEGKYQTVSYIAKGEWNGPLEYTGMGGVDTSRATGITELNYDYEQTPSINTVDIIINTDILSVNVTTSVDITISSYTSENTLTTITKNGSSDIKVTIKDSNGAVYKVINITTDDINLNEDTNATLIGEEKNVYISNGVIELGTEKYPFLITCKEDLYKLNEGGYCQLTAGIVSDSSVTLTSGKETNLDLNDYTLTCSATSTITVEEGATLTVRNSGENATGEIINTNDDGYAFLNKGTLNIQAITITATCDGIDNEGTVTITNATVSGTWGIYNYDENGTVTISNSAIYGSTSAIDNYGTAAINNSTLTGADYGIYNAGGTITISGSTVTGTTGNAIDNEGNLTINNCAVSGGRNGIWAAEGELIVNSSTIAGNNVGIYNESKTTINSGTITGNSNGIYNRGKTTINGGTITGTNYAAIENYDELTINGGTISGETYSGILNDSGELTVTAGTISAGYDSTAIYNKGEGQVEISGGEISAVKTRGGTDSSTMGIVNASGSVTVSGGTITADWGIDNYDVLIMTGGTVKATEGGVENFAGSDVTITGSAESPIVIEAVGTDDSFGYSVVGLIFNNYNNSNTDKKGGTTITAAISGNVTISGKGTRGNGTGIYIWKDNEYDVSNSKITIGEGVEITGEETAVTNNGSILTITGGTYNGPVNTRSDCQTKVSGGTYTSYDPTDYVDSESYQVNNIDGTYTVTEKTEQ